MPGKKGAGQTRVSLQRTVDTVMVHDIKNLAFRLSALLQNMEEHFESPVFRANLAEALGDTVRRMNSMVRNYRDHEQQVILKLKLDLNAILEGLLGAIPSDIRRRIHVDARYGEIPAIWGDAFYLQEAFRNLIQNAIEAMPGEGTLTIQTKRADTRKTPRIEVAIRDTGCGISGSLRGSDLFQPFVTTKENGMGMGLFTARKIFALHRGHILVRSSPDRGTALRIIFKVEDHAV